MQKTTHDGNIRLVKIWHHTQQNLSADLLTFFRSLTSKRKTVKLFYGPTFISSLKKNEMGIKIASLLVENLTASGKPEDRKNLK